MKKLTFILMLSSSLVGAQQIIYGDSKIVRIVVGNKGSAQTISSINPGEKISGTSGKTTVSFGLKSKPVYSKKSNTLPLKVGENMVVSEERSSGMHTTFTNRTNEPAKDEINGVPDYYALIIGVEKYQYASENLFNLSNPLKDATMLKDILITKYSFATTNSALLQNPTRADILKAFEDLAKKVTPKDNILIFYAGHGYWDERLKVGYWLPSDSKTDDKSSWLANSSIRDYIAGIQSKHTLLITDACFSGSIFKTREVNSEINEWGVAKIYQLPSRKAMTSGTLTTVPDESKFMEYLVKRLNENSSKYLTTRQLFYSLETAVLNNTSTVPQLGVIQDTGDEGGDFIFIKR